MRRFADILAVLVLGAYGALLFRRCLFGGKVLFWHDVSLAYIPLREFAQTCIRELRLPLWSPKLGCGFPVLFEGQAGTFYPLHFISYLGQSAARDYGLMCALHCILAAAMMLVLCRALRMSAFAASFAGLTYGFSAFFVCHVMHLPMLEAATWIPLLLCLLERAATARLPTPAVCRVPLPSSPLPTREGGRGAGSLCRAPSPSSPLPTREGGRWVGSSAILLGLVLGLQFLTSFPQAIFSGLIGLAVYAAFILIREFRARRWGVAPRLAATLALMAAVGLGIGCVQWMPTKLQADFSQRRTATTPEYLRELSMAPRNLAYFIHPYAFGSYANNDYFGRDNYYEVCGYVGCLALLLAVVGLLHSDNAIKWYFAFLALLAIFLSLAAVNPLYDVLPRVPGFNLFRGAGRHLVLSTLGLAGLAGLGIDALRTSRRAQRFLAGLGVAVVCLSVAAAVGLRVGRPHLAPLLASSVSAVGPGGEALTPAQIAAKADDKVLQLQRTFGATDPVFALLLLGGLIAAAGGSRLLRPGARFGVVAAALWGVQAMQLFAFADTFNPVADEAYYTSRPFSASIIAASGEDCRVYTDTATTDPGLLLRDYGGWAGGDIAPYIQQREDLQPNRASLYGISCADVQYGLAPKRQYDLLEGAVQAALEQQGSPGRGVSSEVGRARKPLDILRLLGVGYFITRPERLPEPLPQVADFGFCRMYRLDGYMPHCWVVGQTLGASTREEALARACDGSLDFTRTAVIEGLNSAGMSPRSEGPAGAAQVLESSDTRVVVRARAERDGFLILRDAWHPLWRASVDGADVPVYRADYVLRGVPIAAGAHTVEFRFDAGPVRTGGIVSLVTLLLVIAALVVIPRFRRKEP
jgi:hypothetical protein